MTTFGRRNLTARTAFQRKAVSRAPVGEVMEAAIAFFTERGYRSGKAARPNQVYVMGGREGVLPRVTAELLFQANVGKGKVTMVTISGFGEQLSRHLADYAASLRASGRPAAASPAESDEPAG